MNSNSVALVHEKHLIESNEDNLAIVIPSGGRSDGFVLSDQDSYKEANIVQYQPLQMSHYDFTCCDCRKIFINFHIIILES